MAVYSKLPSTHFVKALTLQELPPCRVQANVEGSEQIAAYLKQLLKTFGAGNPSVLKLPSPLALSGFIRCSIQDVLDALYALKMRNYQYQLNGLDGEITLSSPVSGKKSFAGTGKRPLCLLGHYYHLP